MHGWMDGMDGWMDGWMDRWVDGWMVGWLGGWLGGWMDEQTDGWIGCMKNQINFISDIMILLKKLK